MAQRAAERLGETIDVLIEEPAGEGRYGGRAAHQAPEVDGATEVLSSGPLAVGDIVRAVVTGAEGADLAAEATGGPPADGGLPAGRGLVRAALSRPDTGAAEDRGAGTGGVPAPSLINVANALTVARLCLVPVFVVLLLTGGDAARIAACVSSAWPRRPTSSTVSWRAGAA